MIFKDLEFIETRLSRDPLEAERAALLKLKAALESEPFQQVAVGNKKEQRACYEE